MPARAPNAQTVNKAAKTETLLRVSNAKDDLIAIINRRLQRANFAPMTPEGALTEARRLGFQIFVTATFNREDDNFVLDALVTPDSELVKYFGRGTSKNTSVTVQIVRPARELIAAQTDGTSLDDMWVELSNQVRDLRRQIIDIINEGREEQLSDEAAISLAVRLGYGISIDVSYGSGEEESTLDALTRSLHEMYNQFIYNHLGDTSTSLSVDIIYPTQGERAEQSFQDGISNCMLTPIINMFRHKLDSAKSRDQKNRFSSKLNSAIDMEKRYRAHGVPQSHIQKIADEFGINIYIDAPIQGEFLRVSCTGRKYADMHFLNTRINHVDQINEVTLKNTVFVTREALDAKIAELRRYSQYFEYQRHENVITYVRTLEGTFRVRGDNAEFLHDQERKYNLDGGKLCDVQDADLSEFIRSGVRFNTHVDFMDTSGFARITDNEITEGRRDYKEIDMEKAYKNYHRSRFYTGIVVKITDFRKTDRIEGEGYYLITDVVLVGKFKELDAKLGYIYMDDCIYTKPELMFLLDQGCSFKVVAGAWGSSIDFKFEDDQWNEKEGATRLYAKWVGKKAARYDRASHFVSGPLKFLNHVASCIGDNAKARILESGELYVTYDAERSDHMAHVAGYITAHTRIQVYDQLLAMEMDKVIRVASDAIYYIDHEFQITGVFREQQELMKTNFAGLHYVGVDRYNGDFDAIAPARPYNQIEYHEGPGGSGKTHYNLHDKGLVRVLYVAPTHKLARAKYAETGARCVVLARLCSPNPEKWSSLSKYYNVIVVDEVSMMSLGAQEIIHSRFPNHRILFCGDMCQLPHFDGPIKTPGFDPSRATKIPHTKNYRIDEGDHLLSLLNRLRENIDVQGYAREIACEFKQMAAKRLVDNYKADDMILVYANKTKDRLTDMIKERPEIQNKWIVTDKNAKYCNGDIIVGAKPHATCELRHAFTVHSVQGETVDNNLFVCPEVLVDNRLAYTAFSRARRYDQIFMLVN